MPCILTRIFVHHDTVTWSTTWLIPIPWAKVRAFLDSYILFLTEKIYLIYKPLISYSMIDTIVLYRFIKKLLVRNLKFWSIYFSFDFYLNENPVFSNMFHRAIWSMLGLFHQRLERHRSNSTKFPDEFFKFLLIEFYSNFV